MPRHRATSGIHTLHMPDTSSFPRTSSCVYKACIQRIAHTRGEVRERGKKLNKSARMQDQRSDIPKIPSFQCIELFPSYPIF